MTDEPIVSFTGYYAYLSNFSQAPVELDGLIYPTVEHAYQAAKTPSVILRKAIRAAPTPAAAKRTGRSLPLRPDWDQVRIPIMDQLLRQKFAPCQNAAGLLLATGNRELVEGNTWGDRFWGVCSGVGENNLGKLLMAIRSDLRGLAPPGGA